MNDSDINEGITPVILVGLRTDESDEEFEYSVKELESLCEACGLEAVCIVTQTLPHPDPATYIGSGKAEEASLAAKGADAQCAVCLGNLTPAQMKNLQKIIGVTVWDRTRLILEIFSERARTRPHKGFPLHSGRGQIRRCPSDSS